MGTCLLFLPASWKRINKTKIMWLILPLFLSLIPCYTDGQKVETFAHRESPILSDAVSLLSVLGPKFLDTKSAVKSNSDEKDLFSYQNLMTMAFKVILAFFNTSSIEKADTFPTQAVVGTVISAMTGTTDPHEVAKMAKQAVQVVDLLSTLFETLQTSFTAK